MPREQPKDDTSCYDIFCNICASISGILVLIGIVGLNFAIYSPFQQQPITTQQFLIIPVNTTYEHSISLDFDNWDSYYEVSYSLIDGATSETSVNFIVDYRGYDYDRCYGDYENQLIKITKECSLMDNYNGPSSCYILTEYLPDDSDGTCSSQSIKISCSSSSKQAIYAVWKLIPMKKHKNYLKELNFDCPSDWDTAVECTSQEQTATITSSDFDELVLVLRFCAGSHDNDLVMTYSASYNQTWIPYTSDYSDGCSRYRITSEETKVSIPLPLGDDYDEDDVPINIRISTNGTTLPIELKVEYATLQNIVFGGDITNIIVTCLAFSIFSSIPCLIAGLGIHSRCTK